MQREFHDSTVRRFAVDGATITLELHDVCVFGDEDVTNEEHEKGDLRIDGVTRLTEDDVPIESPSYPFEYGRVLQLKMDGNRVYILVEWQTFSPQTQRVAEYGIEGRDVRWMPTTPTPSDRSQPAK